jgi:type IV pilus assembly protein PilB
MARSYRINGNKLPRHRLHQITSARLAGPQSFSNEFGYRRAIDPSGVNIVKRKRLGEILRERGKISAGDLSKVISEQEGRLVHLGELMLERGLIQKPDLASALEEITHIPYLDCATVEPTRDALALVPQSIAERCCALPIERMGARMMVIMAEPQNLILLDELRFTSGAEIAPRLGFRNEILDAILRNYGAAQEPGRLSQPREITEETADGESGLKITFVSTSARQASREAFREVQAEIRQKRTPAVRVVSEVIQAALSRQASDIHIEPQEDNTVIRIRVDGVLRDLMHVPRTMQNSLVSRIKIISDMDIAERRTPQDGRFMVTIGDRQLDMRVSSLPTQYGEKVVMRLLESRAPMMTFVQLGLPATVAENMRRLLELPQGMLLVTGPTGSGKSTTLYSALHSLRKPSVNIVTVEDPVEYVLPGVNQVHVNVRAGLTFASCLRSILRQDPNVIMVGEIRDRETAEIAIKAAQTGHLVLSTLHTNDSVSAVIRLLDLEIPGYLIAASVTGILGQRLVRRLCACREQVASSAEFRERIAELGFPGPTEVAYRAVGCTACDHTGYKGRVGIYELLVVDESVRAAIREDSHTDAIRDAAMAHGLRLMQEDALEKVCSGVTTLDEALRVIPFEGIRTTDCSVCGQNLVPAFRFCPYCGTAQEKEKISRKVKKLVGEGILHS